MRAPVAVLGIFVADLAFRAPRLPVMGETILGQGFKDGPGGKGSNQAIAAARAGADVRVITRIGRDTFGEMAQRAWAADGVDTSAVTIDDTLPTGAAFIFVSTETGNNAIIVESGAAANLSPADVAAAEAAFKDAAATGRDAIVLLSPACASFDQFADFEARGDAFRSAVQALAAGRSARGAA